MTVELNNIDRNLIKRELLNCINFVNRVNITVDPCELSLTSSLIPNSCLLKQLDSGRGVFFDKIHLNLLFSDVVDLTFIRKTLDEGNQITTKYDLDKSPPGVRPYLKPREENYHIPLEYDEGTVKCFYLFCRTVGFFDLSINDVNLTRNHNEVTIEVLPDHPYYKGMITVLF